jgi:death-on-curing protein
MFDYKYFDVEHAIFVHDQIIINSGGILGILNKGLLESSIEHLKNEDYYPDLEDKLTHLFFPLIKIIVFRMEIKELQLLFRLIF